MPRIPKQEYHTRREQDERAAADRCGDVMTAKLHRELAERHRAEANRPEAKPALFQN